MNVSSILYRARPFIPLCAFLWACSPPGPDFEINVPVLEVVRGARPQQQILTGEIAAARAVSLVAPQVGIWPLTVQALIANGSEVKQGDLLVEFDNSTLSSRLDQSYTDLVRAENEIQATAARTAADLADTEMELETGRSELEKAVIAADVPAGVRSDMEHERLQLELEKRRLELKNAEEAYAAKKESAIAEVDVARIELETSRAKLSDVERGMENLALRAPSSGLVILQNNHREDRLFESGDNAQPGMTILRIPDLDSLVVKARLFDVDDGNVQVGDVTRVTLDAYPDQDYQGRVTAVQSVAQMLGRRTTARAFDVTVELERTDPSFMRPGMSAKVEVTRQGGPQVLLAPRAALAFEDDGSAFARLEGRGTREVQIGACSPLWCEVIDGLDEGDRLAQAESRIGSPQASVDSEPGASL